jgi:tRNA threonylcarbamoyl adenosine modification protein (Sua5/YciO/YrdC/YwlC family)
MIDYIISENPDQRIIDKAAKLLSEGELLIVPTDTNWVLLGCCFHKNAVEKMYKIKGEDKSHHFSLLCQNIAMAGELAIIPDDVFRLIRNKVPGHYTFIFDASKKMIKALKASKTDHQVGIRFVPLVLIERLLASYGGPLISTNVTHTLAGADDNELALYSYRLEEAFSGKVSMIIDPGEYEFVGSSTIYDFSDERRECIREGSGVLLF